MRFDIVTIFPDAFSYFNESIIRRAREKKLVDIRLWNIRDFAFDKSKKAALRPIRQSRRTIDDRPYGGGAGMVMMAEPIVKAVEKARRGRRKVKIILTSARGKPLTPEKARFWAKRYDGMIIVCGHYEGIDERVKAMLRRRIGAKDRGNVEEVSIGPYILTGGEIPAMAIVDAVSRHVPGVLGKEESLEEIKGSYRVYTRPMVVTLAGKKYRVPKVLLSGNHQKIREWRRGKYSGGANA